MSKTILIVIGLFILVGIGIQIGNSMDKPVKEATIVPVILPTIIPTPKTDVKINRMPESFRTAYIEGCSPEGVNMVYCECTMQYFESHFTNAETMQIAIDYAETQKMPSEMIDAAAACVDFYK